MSSAPPTGESNIPVTFLRIKNALLKPLWKFDKKRLPVNRQQQSLLVRKLPPEIRRIIWQFALGGNQIEFKALVATQFALLTYKYKWRTVIQMDDGLPSLGRWPNPRHVTGLLKTCRLFLQEGIDEFYDCNRFIFTPLTFWAASVKIMPHHFARLRIVDIYVTPILLHKKDWAQFCKNIAGMTNLRTLYMRLYETPTTYYNEHWSGDLRTFTQKFFGRSKDADLRPICEDYFLNSLYQIDQVQKFEVGLDDRPRGSMVPERHFNAPFRLLWEYKEDKRASLKEEEQDPSERWLMEIQEAAKERRLITAQRAAERFRRELEQRKQEIEESYQSFSG